MAHQVMPRKAVLLPIMLFLSHSPSSPCILHTHTSVDSEKKEDEVLGILISLQPTLPF